MKIGEDVWRFYQQHLGYNNEEMKKFKENPRNVNLVSKAPELMNKTIVFEVVDSHGCNSHHKVGDKLYFDGSGNLITAMCPKRVCFGALNATGSLIYAADELMYAGVDPNEMQFKRVGCGDVGLNCGGWGHIVMEVRVEDRKK